MHCVIHIISYELATRMHCALYIISYKLATRVHCACLGVHVASHELPATLA
jgi:hypothetical protein